MSVLHCGRRWTFLIAFALLPILSQPSQAYARAKPSARNSELAISAATFVGLRTGTTKVEIASINAFDPSEATSRYQAAEPFGLRATTLVKGGLQSMWRAAAGRLPGEHRILMDCRAKPVRCPPAAARFLAVIDRASGESGWTRIAELNRAINLDIRPVSDTAQYGARNLWPTPLMTFQSNAGDCKDYALAKYVALRELGVSADDIRLLVARVRGADEYHAVAAVRFEGRWLVLDNRTADIRADAEVVDYDPQFVLDRDGVKRIAASPQPPDSVKLTKPPAASEPPILFAGPESLVSML